MADKKANEIKQKGETIGYLLRISLKVVTYGSVCRHHRIRATAR